MSLSKFTPKIQQSLCWAALALSAVSAGTLVFAQSGGFVGADESATGRIVPIAPGGAGGVVLEDATDGVTQTAPPQAELPKHWIGILLAPIPDAVRAQVDLPGDQGVLVRQVVPGSPAAHAGIERFDIVLSANDKPIVDGSELINLVQQKGDNGGKLTLDVLRRGEHHSIAITPEARPEPTGAGSTSGQSWGSAATTPGIPNFGPSGPHLHMRIPSSAFGQGFNLNQMPSNLSVNIQKQDDEPTHITVERGNDSWEIVGDDPNSLDELPDDVRPFVERLLSDGSSMTFQMPNMPPAPGRMGPGMMGRGFGGFNDDELQQQLHRMEEQLQQMRIMLQHDLAPLGQPSVPVQPKQPGDAGETETN